MRRKAAILALAVIIGVAPVSFSVPDARETRQAAPLPAPALGHADLLPGASLGIPSILNLRDAGGYTAAGGKVVRRGLAYRSNQLSPVSAADMELLAGLGLKNAFDLRTMQERAARPDQLPPGVWNVWLNVLEDLPGAAPAALEALFRDPQKANAELGGGKIEAMFEQGYRGFVTLASARTSFRTLFVFLSDPNQLPALYHCTTGKDRTGWASAALLSLLGVPREQVMADFLRSNDYILPLYASQIEAFVAGGGDRAIAEAIFGVKPRYLEASFNEMEKHYGMIENYFAQGLGIDAAGQEALRDLYLQ